MLLCLLQMENQQIAAHTEHTGKNLFRVNIKFTCTVIFLTSPFHQVKMAYMNFCAYLKFKSFNAFECEKQQLYSHEH